ncbi:MAG: hypothetical protein ACI9DJ_001901 [Algoriphagus sp.]|jgi:hypothetical protein
MAYIVIPILPENGKQDVELEVTINGQKKELH